MRIRRDQQVLLQPGQQMTIGRYTLRNDGVKLNDDGQKQMVTAFIAVFENGKQVDTMYPARWYFRKHEAEPTTEVAIRRSIAEDLYIVLAADRQSAATQAASLQINVNPLVNWVWFGFGDARLRHRHRACCPSGRIHLRSRRCPKAPRPARRHSC